MNYVVGSLQTHAVGTKLVLRNGANAEVGLNKNGKKQIKFVAGAGTTAAAQKARDAKALRGSTTITKAKAQAHFDKYYARTRKVGRGARGHPVFASPRGRRQARTYDVNHTSNVVDSQRYLGRHGPRYYDFEGVDTGKHVRKARSAKQRANDAKLGARARARRAQVGGEQEGGEQEGGFWW